MTGIYEIVRANGLKPGDTMVNAAGEPIDRSAVIDSHSFIYRETDKGARLVTDEPLSGERRNIWLSDEAIEALRTFATKW